MIASGYANAENGNLIDSKRPFSVPSTPKEDPTAFTSLPIYKQISRYAN